MEVNADSDVRSLLRRLQSVMRGERVERHQAGLVLCEWRAATSAGRSVEELRVQAASRRRRRQREQRQRREEKESHHLDIPTDVRRTIDGGDMESSTGPVEEQKLPPVPTVLESKKRKGLEVEEGEEERKEMGLEGVGEEVKEAEVELIESSEAVPSPPLRISFNLSSNSKKKKL